MGVSLDPEFDLSVSAVLPSTGDYMFMIRKDISWEGRCENKNPPYKVRVFGLSFIHNDMNSFL